MTINCPDCYLIRYCIARLNDRTITGCGIPLYAAGLIKQAEIMVRHTVNTERREVSE